MNLEESTNQGLGALTMEVSNEVPSDLVALLPAAEASAARNMAAVKRASTAKLDDLRQQLNRQRRDSRRSLTVGRWLEWARS